MWSRPSTKAKRAIMASNRTSSTTHATTPRTSSCARRSICGSSWEPDALVLDRVNGIYADPDKIHRADYNGEVYRTRGPLNVPRSPQGRPVIIQAGAEFHAERSLLRNGLRWIFAVQPQPQALKRFYTDIKQVVLQSGRLVRRAEDSGGRPPPGAAVGQAASSAARWIVHDVEPHELRLLAVARSMHHLRTCRCKVCKACWPQ